MTKNVRTTTPTTIPGIPKPPGDVSPALRTYLEAVAEAVEIRLGRRGDPRDRAVTLRELINSGLAEELRGRPFSPNQTSSTNLDFLSPDADQAVPPQPTGFSATGGYSLIQLYWDYPRYGNHSQTEIWRHDSDVIGDAQLVGVAPGLAYVDAVGEGQSYYYWIRHVSTTGVPGPFNASAGTLAETAPNVDLLLDELTGAISASELTAALSTRIDLIDASASVVGSVAYQVAQEAAARAAAIDAAAEVLQDQINDLSAIADWDSTTSYAIDDLVKHTSQLWKAVAANTNSEPTTTNTNWTLIGDYTSLGDAVANNTADILAINFVNSTSTSAAAQAIAALETTVNDASTGVTATATALSGLTTRVSTAETNISTNASDITALENTVNDPATGVAATASAVSSLDTRVTNAESSITSQASDITALQTSVTTNATNITGNTSAISGLDTRVTAAEGSITSQASDITSLQANVTTNSTAITGNATAIGGLDTRVTAAEGTITSQSSAITALENTVNDASTGVTATATALSSLTTTVTNQGSTLTSVVSDVSTLSTTVGNNTTAIQTNATSVNGLEAQYTVKIDNNGAVAGYGLASAVTGSGGITSEFIVNADRFAILKDANDTGTVNVPFIVQTTAETINGVVSPVGVYIADAFVRNGTIVTAKIGNAAIDDAKIADLAVKEGKIDNLAVTEAKIQNLAVTNAKIGNAAITTAKIGDAQITNAKIGSAAVDTLQLAGESVIVPVADTFSGTIAASWPTVRTYLNGLPNPTITLAYATEVLVLWGVRFLGQSSGAGDMLIRIKEDTTTIFQMGGTPRALSTGGFMGGAIRRSKPQGSYTYYMEWSAFNSPLYEAYIILLGIQR